MFKNIVETKARFYDFHSEVAIDLLTKLLEKDPEKRLGSKHGPIEIMQHPFYAGIDWDKLMSRTFETPYKPVLSGATDTSHFDENQTKIMFTPPGSSLPIFEPE